MFQVTLQPYSNVSGNSKTIQQCFRGKLNHTAMFQGKIKPYNNVSGEN